MRRLDASHVVSEGSVTLADKRRIFTLSLRTADPWSRSREFSTLALDVQGDLTSDSPPRRDRLTFWPRWDNARARKHTFAPHHIGRWLRKKGHATQVLSKANISRCYTRFTLQFVIRASLPTANDKELSWLVAYISAFAHCFSLSRQGDMKVFGLLKKCPFFFQLWCDLLRRISEAQ